MQKEHGQAPHTRGAEKENGGVWKRARAAFDGFLTRRAGRLAIPGLTAFLAAFLLARTPLFFGAYPLGLAFLCANRRHTLPAFFGLCVGAATLGVRGFVYMIVYMIALLLRFLFSMPSVRLRALPESKGVFAELPQLQLVTAVTVAAATAAYELAVSGISGATMLFALSMVLGSGLLTVVFSGFFSYGVRLEDVFGNRTARPAPHARWERLWMEAGVISLLFFCAYALREVSVFGLNFGYLLTAFSALFIARRFGSLRGCAAGLLVGMAASTVYAPAFGLLGLLSGALWSLGAFYAMGLGAAAGIAWCSYVGGLSGFLGTAPELAVSVLISLPLLPRLYSDAIAGEVRQDRAAAEEAVRAVCEREAGGDRITRLSEAFDALSHAFSERSLAPDPADCFAVCDEVCTGYCSACAKRGACWDGEGRPAAAALTKMADCVAHGETFETQDMPTALLTGCERLEPLLRDVRRAGARLWRAQRQCAGADYPAPDYALTAELLRAAGGAARNDTARDTVGAATLRRILAERGIRPAAVSVRGERHKQIVVGSNALSGRQREAAELLEKFSEECGCRLTPPRFETGDGVITMETHTAPAYTVEVAYATRAASDSEVSGDCVGHFTTPDGYAYILLSDGMGTGRVAARTAGACALFLEKMLSAGNAEETSLKMLNHLISVRGDECSATVDLMAFDTYYGNATFTKSGAAASYVRREGNLFRLRSKTIPIGLVRDVDAEKLRFDTRENDIVIMLSDGVSQTSEDAPWLVELLSKPLGTSLQTAADNILTQTVRHGGATDDMTVILARIVKL